MNEIDIYSQPSYSEKVKLYHNTKDHEESRLLKFKFRDKPTDTPLSVHTVVNKLSQKKFGLPIRSLFFTYAEYMVRRQMRAIPLGNNVRYFYHPDVDDMTGLIIHEMLEDKMGDYFEALAADYNYDSPKIQGIFFYEIQTQPSFKLAYENLTQRFQEYVDDFEPFTKNALTYLLKLLKEYVDGVIEVDDINKIPPNTDAEIMVYAPDDVYLIASTKRES